MLRKYSNCTSKLLFSCCYPTAIFLLLQLYKNHLIIGCKGAITTFCRCTVCLHNFVFGAMVYCRKSYFSLLLVFYGSNPLSVIRFIKICRIFCGRRVVTKTKFAPRRNLLML